MRTQNCIGMTHVTPTGCIRRFTVPYTLSKSATELTEADMLKIRDKCLALDLKYPVPVGYSVH